MVVDEYPWMLIISTSVDPLARVSMDVVLVVRREEERRVRIQ